MGLLFLILLVTLVVASFAIVGWQGAPWVPTKKADIERFMRLAACQPGQKVYDLGCGDGRLSCLVARTGASVCGVELALIPYLIAQFRRWHSPFRANITFKLQNMWKTPLHDADVIYLFLLPEIYQKFKTKFERELRPGTRIITYAWQIPGWQPVAIDEEPGKLKLYLYHFGQSNT